MADKCDSACGLVDEMLHCELPPDHTAPSTELPQGTPHQDGSYLDILSGEPWRWWG